MTNLFEPKKSKFKKYFRAKPCQRISKQINYVRLISSSIGLKILSFGFISSVQFQAIKHVISKKIKKLGKCVFNAFPNVAKTKKKEAGRMGKGKGNLKIWVYRVRPGFILCEINTSTLSVGVEALISAQHRLPIKTAIIFK